MKDLLTLKNLLVLLGCFVVTNAVMFFLLKATQPKSTIPPLTSTSEQELIDSTAHADQDSSITDIATKDSLESGISPTEHVSVADSTPIEEVEVHSEEQVISTESALEADTSMETQAMELVNAATKGDSKELECLAKLLETMKPKAAAPIMVQLSDETIVALFMRMRERSAAKVMALLPVNRAASVSRLMTQMVEQAYR